MRTYDLPMIGGEFNREVKKQLPQPDGKYLEDIMVFSSSMLGF